MSGEETQSKTDPSSTETNSLPKQTVAPGIQRDIEREVLAGFGINIILYPIVLIYFLVTFIYLTRNVIPYQFIDEKFHIGQTLTYIKGNWLEWDPKITTPPGLYIIGWLNYHLMRPIFKNWSTLTILRLVNFIGGTIVFPVVVLRPLFLFNAIAFWPVSLMCFPLMATYYYLYYTDVWSTIFIIESFTLGITLPFGPVTSVWLSALCAGISCLFRQTNIVWSGFVLVVILERRAMISKGFNTHSFNNYLKLLILSLEEFTTLVLPFAINFILFLVYLVWNRSITLGDKENHTFGIHLMQLFYCFTFILLFSVPHWASRGFLKLYKVRSTSRPIRTVVELILIMIVKRFFTVVHPFLLADNRHYTFYLFRRILNNQSILFKYCITPVLYHFATFAYMELLRPNEMVFHPILPLPVRDPLELPVQLTHISWTALLLCTFITIVPSPLLEPRYYILPFYFWRIAITCNAEPFWSKLVPPGPGQEPIIVSSMSRLLCEFLWFMLINVVTLVVFIKYTFSWADEAFPQRIIW